MKRNNLSKYCAFYENTSTEVVDAVIENCKNYGSDGILGHRTSLPFTSSTGKWWKKLKGSDHGRSIQKMAVKHLEDRQEHQDAVHSSIPKYWDRLTEGTQAISKFKQEQLESLDEEMMEILKTDLADQSTLLHLYSLAPLEAKIENSTWDERWITLESLTKRNIEESLKNLLRKPIDFEVMIDVDSDSEEEEIAPPTIPKTNEVVIWNMVNLAREDVTAAMVKEKIVMFTTAALKATNSVTRIFDLAQEVGVVLICRGEEEEKRALSFKKRIESNEMTLDTLSVAMDGEGSDDDDVPLVQVVKRKKALADLSKKRKERSLQGEGPRKKAKKVAKRN